MKVRSWGSDFSCWSIQFSIESMSDWVIEDFLDGLAESSGSREGEARAAPIWNAKFWRVLSMASRSENGMFWLAWLPLDIAVRASASVALNSSTEP